MYEQNVTLRKHALDKFRPFLLEMSKDTAMLIWLDSNQNVKGAPNENYAREVMELFSLGVGNYSEMDVKEAARSFTGWHHDAEGNKFENNPPLDDHEKMLLNKTGGTTSESQDQPARSPYRQTHNYLVMSPAAVGCSITRRVVPVSVTTSCFVRSMFAAAVLQRVRIAASSGGGYAAASGRLRPRRSPISPSAAKMGQVLFNPPNVKGWRTGTLLGHALKGNNFAELVAMGEWAGKAWSAGAATSSCTSSRPTKALKTSSTLRRRELIRLSGVCCKPWTSLRS